VRLTEAGEALFRHADAILARLADAEAELEAIAGLRGGRLRLAAFESAGATLMPPAIAAFRARHPAVELSLTLAEPEESIPRLHAGELDLALIFDSGPPARDTGIERLHLLDDPLLLVLGADHPLARRRTLRLADLADEAWIGGCVGGECNRLVNGACAAAGFTPRFAFETDDYTAMQGFVAAGVGVSLIAELGLRSVRDDVVVRSLGRETPVRRIHAATAAGAYRSPATAAMLEILGEVAAGYRGGVPALALAG
jgi:DNA-binding transcriptional LysR family regulator